MLCPLLPFLMLSGALGNRSQLGLDPLNDLAQRAAQYFWDQSNPVTGLCEDRANNFSRIPINGIPCSLDSTGYALASYAVDAARGWKPYNECLQRSIATVSWMNYKGTKMHGWLYHWVIPSTGDPTWDYQVSSSSTALFVAGAIVAEHQFNNPVLTAEVQKLIGEIDWKWMLTNGGALPNSTTFCMGYQNGAFLPNRWDYWYEMAILNLQGMGASSVVPASLWTSIHRNPVHYAGYTYLTGGPIFMHQMSQEYVGFKGLKDELGYDYWEEGNNACLAEQAYSVNNPGHFKGYNRWFFGQNAMDVPEVSGGRVTGTGYEAHGVPPGSDYTAPDDGTISPSGELASAMYDPTLGKETASYLVETYPNALGLYGFGDSMDPTYNWFDDQVIGIDAGMLLLGIEDAQDGLVQRLSMEDPIYIRGMAKAGFKPYTGRSGVQP